MWQSLPLMFHLTAQLINELLHHFEVFCQFSFTGNVDYKKQTRSIMLDARYKQTQKHTSLYLLPIYMYICLMKSNKTTLKFFFFLENTAFSIVYSKLKRYCNDKVINHT